MKKVGWSLVLLIPFAGWIFYGAFYAPLSENSVPAPTNGDVAAGSKSLLRFAMMLALTPLRAFVI